MKTKNIDEINKWNRIINEEKVLSNSEAEEMTESIKKIRKEKGFRK